MLFEGSEKKIEFVLKAGQASLLERSEDFWAEMVTACRAQILSKIESPSCKAFLLSESSLFVWEDRLTLITCGTTRLANAAQWFLKQCPPENVAAFYFQRKNEYFPHHQETDFFTDARLLSEIAPGKAWRFGRAEDHHLFLFEMKSDFRPEPDDTNLEILMYGLKDKAYEIFTDEKSRAEDIRSFLKLEEAFPGWTIDDYVFDPVGYSLNAVKDSEYLTIHVTPQDSGPYVSFETNSCSYSKEIASLVLESFKPDSFDVVSYDPGQPCTISDWPGYLKKSQVREKIQTEFNVDYAHFYQPQTETSEAFELKI